MWNVERRENGGRERRHWVAVDEAWRIGDRDESFEGVKARGQRKDMVEYGVDASFVCNIEARCYILGQLVTSCPILH